jgi:hypothetical protein
VRNPAVAAPIRASPARRCRIRSDGGSRRLSPAVAFALPSGAGPAEAEHRHHHRGFHLYKVVAEHAQELGIAPATVESMKAAFQSARPDFERLHQGLQQARQSSDPAKIAAAQSALQDRHRALRAQIDGMLTDQQKAGIKQLMERHHREPTHEEAA